MELNYKVFSVNELRMIKKILFASVLLLNFSTTLAKEVKNKTINPNFYEITQCFNTAENKSEFINIWESIRNDVAFKKAWNVRMAEFDAMKLGTKFTDKSKREWLYVERRAAFNKSWFKMPPTTPEEVRYDPNFPDKILDNDSSIVFKYKGFVSASSACQSNDPEYLKGRYGCDLGMRWAWNSKTQELVIKLQIYVGYYEYLPNQPSQTAKEALACNEANGVYFVNN